MKKLAKVLLGIIVLLSFVSCGNNKYNVVSNLNQVENVLKEEQNKTNQEKISTQKTMKKKSIEKSVAKSKIEDIGTIQYGEVVLYEKPKENVVCIKVQPSMLRENLSYYYIPEGKEQVKLKKLVNEIDEQWKKHKKRWQGMKEVGWTIYYNKKEYDVFEDGYLYRTKTDDEKGILEYLEQKKELYQIINSALEKIGYHYIDITQIKNIVSAKLELTGFRAENKKKTQIITDKKILSKLEKWFSKANYIVFGADCCNQYACLELTLENKKKINLSLATDSCSNYGVNGVYYDYRPKEKGMSSWNNNELFQYFNCLE